jgi:hypothetical protein
VDTGFYHDTNAWYQKLLPFDLGLYNTASDAVFRGFSFSKALGFEDRFRLAYRQTLIEKEQIRLLTEEFGFVLPSGVKEMCPRELARRLEETEEIPVELNDLNGGAPPVPFDSLVRAFLLAPFYEVEDNSAAIWRALANNPQFLEQCRFPGGRLPDVRTFQRFNEVMNTSGLWGDLRQAVVRDNIHQGFLTSPSRIAIDPGHMDGYAAVRKPCAACRACGICDAGDQVMTCDVTDIVAKRVTYKFPGVKGSFISDPDTDMPLMGEAMVASDFDGRTGKDAAEAFVREYPELVAGVKEVSLDGAYDIADEKEGIAEVLQGADVLTPINPRRRKNKKVKGHRGILHIDPYGRPVCKKEVPMPYRGRDIVRETFIYGCPAFNAESRTVDCPHQGTCCPNPGTHGRQHRVPRSETPYVDWENPQHSADFKLRYNGRTCAERSIARTKRSFPFERHWGRGRVSLQGHLDKAVLAFHVLFNAAHHLERNEEARSPLTFHKCKIKAA